MLWHFFHRQESSVLEASKKEQHEAIERITSQATFRSGYYMLLMVSVLIVTPGLLLNNVSVIIGGMILAPLIIPTMSLSLSLVSGNLHGCINALRILFFSILIAICTAALFTLFMTQTYNVVNWIPDRISPGIYTFIAFFSGMAGAFALVKENLAPTIAGVAIAVSLLPPICAVGIGIALHQWMLVENSIVLVTSNFLGIALAAFLVFWLLGFPSASRVQEKILKQSAQ